MVPMAIRQLFSHIALIYYVLPLHLYLMFVWRKVAFHRFEGVILFYLFIKMVPVNFLRIVGEFPNLSHCQRGRQL